MTELTARDREALAQLWEDTYSANPQDEKLITNTVVAALERARSNSCKEVCYLCARGLEPNLEHGQWFHIGELCPASGLRSLAIADLLNSEKE